MHERAVDAAVATARELGVRVEDPHVLRAGSNLLVALRPAPLVARVATATAPWRPGTDWLAREVAVAGALARAGAPVVAPAPDVPPGPHERDGFALSLWERVEEQDPASLDGYAAGRALRACHEVLAAIGAALAAPRAATASDASARESARQRAAALDLPRWGALAEAAAILERLAADGDLSTEDATLLRATGERARARVDALDLPLQPIHGDAHLGNVLATARGPLWNDWEDAFLGPVEWDVACLHAAAKPFGRREPIPIAQAYRGRDLLLHADVLRPLVAARRWQMLVWGVALGRTRPESNAWARERIGWLRERGTASIESAARTAG